MKKDESQPIGGAKEGRRPTGAPSTGFGWERGRFNSQPKAESLRRLLWGEELDVLSPALGVSASTLAGWKEAFLAAGEARLKSR